VKHIGVDCGVILPLQIKLAFNKEYPAFANFFEAAAIQNTSAVFHLVHADTTEIPSSQAANADVTLTNLPEAVADVEYSNAYDAGMCLKCDIAPCLIRASCQLESDVLGVPSHDSRV